MAIGGQQPNKRLSREEYERKIAGDISGRRVEITDADDIIAAEPEEELAPSAPTQNDRDSDQSIGEVEGEEQEGDRETQAEQPAQPVQPSQRVKQTPEEQLEKGEVPKYAEESPEAYKQPPGGPAVQPKKPGLPSRGGQAVKQGASKAGQAVSSGAKAAGNAIKEAAVKAAQQVAKAAAQVAAKLATAALSNPYVLGAVLIIIILIGLGIAAFALWPNRSIGSTVTQAADVINDRELIFKILALANDPEAAQKLDGMLSGLETELTSIESVMQRQPYASWPADTKTKITEKIKNIRDLITKFRATTVVSNERRTIANDIIKNLGELLDLFSPAPFYYITGPNNGTSYPVALADVKGYNNRPHGGTPLTPKIPGHGTFEQNNKGTADAVDILGIEGTPVKAAFSGTIVEKFEYFFPSKRLGRLTNFGWIFKVRGADAEGKTFLAVYAHLQNPTSKGKGDTVSAGDPLGEMKNLEVSSTHLHFELFCNGHAATTSREEYTDSQSSNPKYQVYGKYLFIKMLNVLKLPLQ